MKKHLCATAVIAIAKKLASELGVTIPSDEKIMKEFSLDHPVPMIVNDSGYYIWLDLHYIAYIAPGEDEVRYVFISYSHIVEECNNYKYVRKRGKHAPIPPEIKAAFRTALQKMRETGKKYYIFSKDDSKYREMIVNIQNECANMIV